MQEQDRRAAARFLDMEVDIVARDGVGHFGVLLLDACPGEVEPGSPIRDMRQCRGRISKSQAMVAAAMGRPGFIATKLPRNFLEVVCALPHETMLSPQPDMHTARGYRALVFLGPMGTGGVTRI